MITYTPLSLLGIAALAVLASLCVPLVYDSATVVETKKHRLWFTRRGWSYDYNRDMAGKGIAVQLAGGFMTTQSPYWSTGGFWPWHHSQADSR